MSDFAMQTGFPGPGQRAITAAKTETRDILGVFLKRNVQFMVTPRIKEKPNERDHFVIVFPETFNMQFLRGKRFFPFDTVVS